MGKYKDRVNPPVQTVLGDAEPLSEEDKKAFNASLDERREATKHGFAQMENLGGGRKKGSIANKIKAEARHTEWKKAAINMYMTEPQYALDEIVAVIRKQKIGKKKNGEPYNGKVIKRKLRGTKKEAMQLLAEKQKENRFKNP